jgi:hypothetical protein
MSRYFSMATSVTVDHDTPLRVFRSQEFGHAFVIISNGAGAEVALNAASPEAMLAWLGEASRAVEALMAPVLPLEDVLSTHPAEVAR